MLVRFTYLILLITALSYGQEGDYFLSIKKYPFINYSANEISFPSDSTYFESIYQKLDSLVLFGKGKINIVHIGGSHIQADIYTHQIRKHLQSIQYAMNGGRGLIFPFNIAKTNNPWNYKVKHTGKWEACKNTKYKRSCQLGLTGMSVTTGSNNASIQIDCNNDSTTSFYFEDVRIYHAPTKYSIQIQVKDLLYQGFYDSTYGYSLFEVPQSNLMNLKLSKPDSVIEEFTLYGISLDNSDPGIVYNSIGVNGSKLESYLYCNLYKEHLASIKPDLVIFSIGTNDGNTKHFNSQKYYREYWSLINETKEACPNTKILLTVPNDAYYYKRYVNKNTVLIQKEIYKLASNNNYGVWDFFSVMGGLNSSQKWYNYGIMKYDRVHFNKNGYLLKGDLFVTAFLKGWEKNLSNRGQRYFDRNKLNYTLVSSQKPGND